MICICRVTRAKFTSNASTSVPISSCSLVHFFGPQLLSAAACQFHPSKSYERLPMCTAQFVSNLSANSLKFWCCFGQLAPRMLRVRVCYSCASVLVLRWPPLRAPCAAERLCNFLFGTLVRCTTMLSLWYAHQQSNACLAGAKTTH